MRKFYFLPFLFLSSLCGAVNFANGPNAPGTAVNDTSIGTPLPWIGSTNCFISDNIYATAAVQAAGDDKPTSNYLKATNFNFSLNPSFPIIGIKVDVERAMSVSESPGDVDLSVKIVKRDLITGTDHKAVGNWPTSDTFKTYGSATDLWGTTWTASDINDSGFGVVVAVEDTGVSNNTAKIDYIQITVYSIATVVY